MVLLLGTLTAACGGTGSGSPSPPTTAGTTSPSNQAQASGSPAPSPLPSEGGYGVLLTSTAEASYAISLVGFDGKVVAKAQASSPGKVTCGDAAAAVLPLPVSTSNSRAYFMDAQGIIRFLTPSGATGRATSVPVGSQRRSMFAVSADDKLIAVVVSDFSASGAALSLYVEDLNGGGHHKVIYTSKGAFGLWPTGWHGGSLVVAKVPSCTQGGGPFCCGPQELHVVDSSTALRKSTLGSAGCVIAGPPSSAGAVCETGVQANVMDWTGTTTRSFSIQGPTLAYLSPNGNQAAMVSGGETVVEGSLATFGMPVCGWIDSTRLLEAGGPSTGTFPSVADIVANSVNGVGAEGDCAGRIPGGL